MFSAYSSVDAANGTRTPFEHRGRTSSHFLELLSQGNQFASRARCRLSILCTQRLRTSWLTQTCLEARFLPLNLRFQTKSRSAGNNLNGFRLLAMNSDGESQDEYGSLVNDSGGSSNVKLPL